MVNVRRQLHLFRLFKHLLTHRSCTLMCTLHTYLTFILCRFSQITVIHGGVHAGSRECLIQSWSIERYVQRSGLRAVVPVETARSRACSLARR